MNKNVMSILAEMKKISSIEAIAIGGSIARGKCDENSDYDLYVYYSEPLSFEDRKSILDKYSKYMEYSNTYWEEEDDGILCDGLKIEIIYRDISFLEEVYNNFFVNCTVSYGYSTCLIENIHSSIIVHDKKGVYKKYQELFDEYSETLRKEVIFKNLELLDDKMPSLSYQLIKAIERKDLININNRLSEFMAIYIDIIFALNKKYNIGEKRLLEEISKLDIVPKNATNDIEELLKIIMIDFSKSVDLVKKISEDLYVLVNLKYKTYNKTNFSKHIK